MPICGLRMCGVSQAACHVDDLTVAVGVVHRWKGMSGLMTLVASLLLLLLVREVCSFLAWINITVTTAPPFTHTFSTLTSKANISVEGAFQAVLCTTS